MTLSVSLAVALGACSLGLAGGHGKSLPSAQGIYPSEQVVASPQGYVEGCGDVCAPAKKPCFLSGLFKHKPKCYTYEWVLKKKRCGGGLFGKHHGGDCGGEASCDSCGTTYPSAQGWPSPQGVAPAAQWPAGQTYGAGQAYGAGQIAPAAPAYSAGQIAPAAPAAAAPAGDIAPPAPETPPAAAPEGAAPAPPTASNGGLLFLNPAGN